MTRFFGPVGFDVPDKVRPGVFMPGITEKNYSGDVLQVIGKWQDHDEVNRDLTTQHRFSIIADPFAEQNYHTIRYIIWNGAKWKVTSVEVKRPRLILSIGGLYNVDESKTGVS